MTQDTETRVHPFLGGSLSNRYRQATASPPEEIHMAAFPVGSAVLIERKKVTKNPITVTAGQYTSVGRITIPKGGHFLLTNQIRLAGGQWAKVKFVRIGWGKDPDGRDETGLHPYRPCPDGQAFSDSFTHPLNGGGPVECHVKVLGVPKGTKVTLETSIFKAYRDR